MHAFLLDRLAMLTTVTPPPLIRGDPEMVVTLLVRIGVVAAMASMLARFDDFKAVLFRGNRGLTDQLQLGAWLGLAFGFGAGVRVTLGYKAPDLGLEGALLAGLLGGPVVGIMAAGIMSVPALLYGQWVTVPVIVLAATVGAGARHLSPEVQEIWHFSPFVDMNIFRWYQRRFGKPRGDWQMMFFLIIVVIEIACMYFGRLVHGHWFYRDGPVTDAFRFFYLDSEANTVKFAIVMTGIVCVAIPIRIWNNTRNELLVEEQGRLLVEARLAALTNQINPHFLFNTLNSISSLTRIDPERARVMIQKMATILRRMIYREDAFAWLSEELDLVDNYLDIEVVRFGSAKLKIVKQIEDAALSVQVPSMILQPLVENSIKHGISARVSGGVVCIRARVADGRLHLEVEDNGEGMDQQRLVASPRHGIGLSNVRERLAMLYGADHTFEIDSERGRGTRIRIELPEAPEMEAGRAHAAGAGM